MTQSGPYAALPDPFSAVFSDHPPARVAVAVSGGGDSMALLHMAQNAPFGWQVTALTVDHGLRSDSASEAAQVATYCARTGTPHHILRWTGPNPGGNLMDQARQARFALIAKAARTLGIDHVLLGHTADDNAETFLMNLARQAGIDGLSGMRSDWHDMGIRWHRPLLQAARADLRAYLAHHSVAWIDDPTNENPRYTRIKARRALAALAPLGITPQTLSATIANLAEAQAALTLTTVQAARTLTLDSGALTMPDQTLADLPPEIARRLLSAIVRWMNGEAYAPRGSQLQTLQDALQTGKPATLGGCRFRPNKTGLRITRETRAVQGPVPFGSLWDHRWRISGPAHLGHEIRALGAEGLALCPDWRNHGQRDALVTGPAVWAGDTLIAAPLAGESGPYQADVSQSLAEFILSH